MTTTNPRDEPRIPITRLAAIMGVSPDSIRRSLKSERIGAILDDEITRIQARRWASVRWCAELTRQSNSLRRIDRLFDGMRTRPR